MEISDKQKHVLLQLGAAILLAVGTALIDEPGMTIGALTIVAWKAIEATGIKVWDILP